MGATSSTKDMQSSGERKREAFITSPDILPYRPAFKLQSLHMDAAIVLQKKICRQLRARR